jgi:hypothetical protein
VFSLPTHEEQEQKAVAIVRERLGAGIGKISSLLSAQADRLWSNTEHAEWAFSHIKDAELDWVIVGKTTQLNLMRNVAAGFHAGVFAVFLLSIILSMRKPPRMGYWTILLVFFMYFGAHLLIEIQPRYRDFGMIAVFAASAYAIEFLCDKTGKRGNAATVADIADTHNDKAMTRNGTMTQMGDDAL